MGVFRFFARCSTSPYFTYMDLVSSLKGLCLVRRNLTHCHEKVIAQVELASSACPFLKSHFQTIFESILEVFLGKQLKYFVISGIYAGYIES